LGRKTPFSFLPVYLRLLPLYPFDMPTRKGSVPPMTEAAFLKRYFLIWVILGACCVVVGLAIGPRMNHSHNPWLAVVVAFSVYAFSVLLCRIVVTSLWRRPEVTPAVLFFSIPVGAAGIGALMFMRSVGPTYLFVEQRTLRGLAFAVALLYGGALVWGICIGIHRKKMGCFDIERVP
jgi:hypothetical protein